MIDFALKPVSRVYAFFGPGSNGYLRNPDSPAG